MCSPAYHMKTLKEIADLLEAGMDYELLKKDVQDTCRALAIMFGFEALSADPDWVRGSALAAEQRKAKSEAEKRIWVDTKVAHGHVSQSQD